MLFFGSEASTERQQARQARRRRPRLRCRAQAWRRPTRAIRSQPWVTPRVQPPPPSQPHHHPAVFGTPAQPGAQRTRRPPLTAPRARDPTGHNVQREHPQCRVVRTRICGAGRPRRTSSCCVAALFASLLLPHTVVLGIAALGPAVCAMATRAHKSLFFGSLWTRVLLIVSLAAAQEKHALKFSQ